MSGSIQRRVLIVEDNAEVGSLVADLLGRAGIASANTSDAAGGFAVATEENPDAILLDVHLPDGNGFELCRRMRASGVSVPILFLTGRNRPEEVVQGFEAGADDYVTKPFSPIELVARVKALLRRTRGPTASVIESGPVRIDLSARRVTRDGEEVALTRTEYDILRLLVGRSGAAVARPEFLATIWRGVHVTPRTVDTHVTALRGKLGPSVTGRSLIASVRGVGYRWEGE